MLTNLPRCTCYLLTTSYPSLIATSSSVFATIAPARDNRGHPPTPETAALRARMQEVHAESDIDNVGDTTSGISQALCFAADKMMNAYALNISTNYKSYLLRVTDATIPSGRYDSSFTIFKDVVRDVLAVEYSKLKI